MHILAPLGVHLMAVKISDYGTDKEDMADPFEKCQLIAYELNWLLHKCGARAHHVILLCHHI